MAKSYSGPHMSHKLSSSKLWESKNGGNLAEYNHKLIKHAEFYKSSPVTFEAYPTRGLYANKYT